MRSTKGKPLLALAALSLVTTCAAHPGNGIVVLADGSVITGDAVGSAVWRFRDGAAPQKIVGDFHCHWVTHGRDGSLYGDLVEVNGGQWTTAFHRLDLRTKRTTQVWRGGADASVFLVDEDSSVVMFDGGRLFTLKPGKERTPFRGNGRPASGEPTPTMAKAMAWGPSGDVYLLERNRLWVAGADGTLRIRATFAGRATGMYAGPNGQVQPWGLDVDSAGRAIVADPSRASSFGSTNEAIRGWWPAAREIGRSWESPFKEIGSSCWNPRPLAIRTSARGSR